MKLTKQDKIEIIKQQENEVPCASTISQFNISYSAIYYLYALYKKHGDCILDSTYHHYGEQFKIQAVKRVKNGETIFHVAIDLKLSNRGTLSRWLKEFDNNCGRIPKRKRGRKPMKKNKYLTNLKSDKLTDKKPEEEIRKLKKQLIEKEAEIEYLKKLRALVQAEKQQQNKK